MTRDLVTDEVLPIGDPLIGDPGQTWAVRWLEDCHKEVSLVGRRCAQLVDWTFDGIYHRQADVLRADWSGSSYVELHLTGDFSTWDFNYLTRLVVGAHDRAIRVEISPLNFKFLRVMMHPREGREGSMFYRHPTMEDAVRIIRSHPSGH